MHVLREYSLSFLFALALHAAVALALYKGWSPNLTEPRVIKPKAIATALIIRERPQAKPVAKPAPRPVATKSEPTLAPPPADPVPDAKPPEPKVDSEIERRRTEEEARLARLEEMRKSAFDQALAEEAVDLVEDAQADAALSFSQGIYAAIVAQWSRPPSARNEMSATIRVELFPTGELNTVSLVESSGNEAFDRSALAAVRKARRFEVPKDSSLFEKEFRKFTLLFKPEDLLR